MTAPGNSPCDDGAATQSGRTDKPLLGWREWVGLPQLGIARIKAKIDTGARTSSLHGLDMQPFRKGHRRFVRFSVPVALHDAQQTQLCVAPLIDRRAVRSSSGCKRYRYVVKTRLQIGHTTWPIELTLSNRARMGFRLLIGRSAIRKRFLVDPAASFLQESVPALTHSLHIPAATEGEIS
ncbi:MAG: ATP-dependent zinc protease [Magnetococcales bacterium]|nr:ATP-dependent zinc protease [Magnetococcales bacterium]MBF0115904.1 ATP-dependent zinc protease [Magnetococcales bacterium]